MNHTHDYVYRLLSGWLKTIRQQNKAIRRKNKIIHRLRKEIAQMKLDEATRIAQKTGQY